MSQGEISFETLREASVGTGNSARSGDRSGALRVYTLMASLYALDELAAMKEKPVSVYEERDLLIAG